MRKRQVQIPVLCEDGEHLSFVRGYLEKRGYDLHKVRVLYGKRGRGGGKHFVRTRYVEEVRAARKYRRVNQSETYALVVMIDQDAPSEPDAYLDLDRRLTDAGHERRGEEEPVAILAPRYCVETWARYLLGSGDVDEATDFSEPKYGIATGECRRAGAVFAGHSPPENCPLPSLVIGCRERARIPAG